jgi:hypothetical protein
VVEGRFWELAKGKKLRLFQCHSHDDNFEVLYVAQTLKKTHPEFKVWVDEWELRFGDSLLEKIGDAIDQSDRLIVFLTPHSVDSNWVRKEVAAGIVMELAEEKGGNGNIFVVPVVLQHVAKIPFTLRDKLYCDFTKYANPDEAIEALALSLLGEKKIEEIRTYRVSLQEKKAGPPEWEYDFYVDALAFGFPQIRMFLEVGVPIKKYDLFINGREFNAARATSGEEEHVKGYLAFAPIAGSLRKGQRLTIRFTTTRKVDPSCMHARYEYVITGA